MKTELYTAVTIFIIFIIIFYAYAVQKRWGPERIGTMASENIFKDGNINPLIQIQGKNRPTYNSITPTNTIVDKENLKAYVTFLFTHQNATSSTHTYTFDLRDWDTDLSCFDTFCISV